MMNNIGSCFLVLVLVSAIGNCLGNDIKRLTKHLLMNYERVGIHGLPAENASVPVEVQTGLTLTQILHLDEHNEVFTFTGYLKMMWTDPLLQWDPKDYQDITSIAVPATSIWTPDFVIYNAAAPVELLYEVPVHVSSSGFVAYVTAVKASTSCSTDEEDTTPSCSIVIGSWTQNSGQVKIVTTGDRVDTKAYVQNNDFELFGTEAVQKEKEYPCCPGTTYGSVSFTINLKQRPRKNDKNNQNSNGCSTVKTGLATFAVALLSLLRL